MVTHNLTRSDFTSINFVVRAVVLAQGGAFQRNTGEEAASARVSQYLGMHLGIRGSR